MKMFKKNTQIGQKMNLAFMLLGEQYVLKAIVSHMDFCLLCLFVSRTTTTFHSGSETIRQLIMLKYRMRKFKSYSALKKKDWFKRKKTVTASVSRACK